MYSLMTAGLIVAIENRNPSYALKFEADCTNSMNMVSSRNAMKTTDYIRPLSWYITKRAPRPGVDSLF